MRRDTLEKNTQIGFSTHKIPKFKTIASVILNLSCYLKGLEVELRLFKPVITNIEEQAGRVGGVACHVEKASRDDFIFDKKS